MDPKEEFCLILAPGSYSLEVKGSVVFAPKVKRIHVVDQPLKDIRFHQKKIRVGISVHRLPDATWGDLTIELKTSFDPSFSERRKMDKLEQKSEEETIAFLFENISPGDYTIEVDLRILSCISNSAGHSRWMVLGKEINRDPTGR